MKFFTSLSLATLATASALLPRDANTLVTDVNAIATQLKSIDSAVKSFSGDTSAALAIQQQVSTLENAITQATKDTQASAALNDADSTKVASAILALQSPIKSALDDLVTKKAAFNSAIPGAAITIIHDDLTTLKSDTDAFGQAIEAKLSQSYAAEAPAIIQQIDSEFTAAINAYAS